MSKLICIRCGGDERECTHDISILTHQKIINSIEQQMEDFKKWYSEQLDENRELSEQIQSLQSDLALAKDLLREAIKIGQPEPADQFHADQMEEWLERAEKLLTDSAKTEVADK